MGNNNLKGSLELNWINKDKALLYEIDEKEGMGVKPVWVDKDDIRVSEPRNLKLMKEFRDPDNENVLIKGDNLLALQSLVEEFKNRDEGDKVKCIYIDPPFNTGRAFERYDDNLEHSQWLTMMRDRLVLLKKLMRKDGVIFVHINHLKMAHLKLLMNEIFGGNNFLQIVTVKSATTASFRSINTCPVTVTEYLLMYSRDREYFKNKMVYVVGKYTEDYGSFIENFDLGHEHWKIVSLRKKVLEKTEFKNWKEAKNKWGDIWQNIRRKMMENVALREPEKVISLNTLQKPSERIKKVINLSKTNRGKVFKLERGARRPIYIYNGRTLAFFKDKIRIIGKTMAPAEVLTNFWDDISYLGIGPEGGVEFLNGKKPEALIKRVIELSTDSGELVLDSFLGSGTTAAVAHKMGRRWIGVEIGKHADTHCIPRLKRVISGEDQTGVSKELDWKSGGGFRYYVVGDSLIRGSDINWELTYEEITRALFRMFDYSFVGKLEDEIYVGRRKAKYSLSIASKDLDIIKNGDLEKIIETVKRRFKNMTELEIYTNKGIGIKEEDLPEGVSIKKIPESVLRKYEL